MVFGYFFGASELLSAFRIAFLLPNLGRRLFGEGALSSALIPVLSRTLEEDGETVARRFFGSLLLVLVLVLGALVLAAEGVIAVWRSIGDDTALALAAILIPYMALVCTIAILGGVLNVRRHFAMPAICPMILNLAIISAVLLTAGWLNWPAPAVIEATCLAILIGGGIQLVLLILTLKRIGFLPSWGNSWRDPRLRKVFTLMGPMVIGLSAVQINTLSDHLIAYIFVFDGAQRVGPAVLGYAQYIYQLPLGVFGIAIATAIFPVLSQLVARDDHQGMAETLGRGIRLSLFIALPASVGLMFVSKPLVATLFEHGAFDASKTARVSGVLIFYSMGIVAYFLNHVLIRAFYALHESRTPARVALFLVGINFALNLVLVQFLEERGLALATAFCAILQAGILTRRLRRVLPQWRLSTDARPIVQIVVATALMAGALALAQTGLRLQEPDTFNEPVELAIMLMIGIGTYAVSARLLGIEELDTVLRRKPVATATKTQGDGDQQSQA